MESYFVAGRSLPWWWLGTSMAATTFAADTPLAVTGLVANHGVAGNWFWWSWAISYVSMAVVFAALWRRARVLTDAELVELRYTGPSATFLRGFKAVFFAVVINGIVLGWVIRAMTKITNPFARWEAWIGSELYAGIAEAWPAWLLFGTLGDTLTILVLFALVVVYSTLGGIRGVILTDLVQFAIGIVASVALAVIAVQHVGGLEGMRTGMDALYPDSREMLSFVPSWDAAWLPIQVFAIYLAVQWWAQYFSDGTGYLAQRLFTARTDRDAEAGGLWFCVANFGLRTWPWILVAVVALIVFPLGAEGSGPAAAAVAGDREMAYPILMGELLPAGLLGLMIASLLAAFMSTVDTHINWGSSYLVNDLYRRFLRPDASERELVAVSRATVVGLALLAVLIAARITTIEGAWRFFVALGAGLGLPAILRWLWWRANAWTEIAGMVVATAAALILYSMYPDARDEYLLVVIVALSTTASLAATFLTAPVPRAHLEAFAARVRPPGWWRDYGVGGELQVMRWIAATWAVAVLAVFGLTFGTGHILFGRPATGALMLVAGALGIGVTLAGSRRARQVATSPAPGPTTGAAAR